VGREGVGWRVRTAQHQSERAARTTAQTIFQAAGTGKLAREVVATQEVVRYLED
jgi:hypothetical protein